MPTATPAATAPAAASLAAAIDAALARIPPLWPLKHFVAVNPFVGLLDRPFNEACALLQRSVGAAPLQSPADYLAAYRSGAISLEDLAAAAQPDWSAPGLVAALETAESAPSTSGALATVADLLDEERPRAHWSLFVVEEIAKYCAARFDENQTTWNSPWKHQGLYTSWRDAALHDRNPETFGLTGFRAFVAGLPADAEACIAHCLALLDPRHASLTDFLHRQLSTLSGWAGYVQYLVREDALRGKTNPALRDLLALRLAYDAALFHAFGRDGVFRADWRHQKAPVHDATTLEALVRWQLAYERGFQRQLAHSLAAAPSGTRLQRPAVQAVFCIDVRSEIFRRHLEAALPSAQTLGFAGFFGFPVAHRPAGAPAPASRCPVLLVPPVETCEPLPPAQAGEAVAARAEAGAWKAFQNSAASCFSFVETAGLAFGAALARRSAGSGPACSRVAPDFAAAPPATRAALAEGALRNMSLVKNFARLVFVCGHGSQSANNPYASALDCGACGGHAGDVNARLAAATLNDPFIRALLAERGVSIPDDTVFIAGLHNTATDDVALLDLEHVPETHRDELALLRSALARAGAATRRERAPALGLAGTPEARLDAAVRARASDISQVRPEWGLANNAALIAAPRSRSAGLKLEGRVFLHDYDATLDPENKVLTLILCAPVVVASWINLQYYASRVDPQRYGSGNKVLHHVVGGLGVMEGNSGDLRVGLPLQSIHDGEKFVHEPRRLTVYIDVEPARIDAVLDAQPAVKQLFDHGWIHLIALHGARALRHTPAGWRAV
jgi:uncharacterized protein YbcC (UPF0753/DUF2309 family)